MSELNRANLIVQNWRSETLFDKAKGMDLMIQCLLKHRQHREYELANECLVLINVSEFANDWLVCLLTVTTSFAGELPAREQLYKDCVEKFTRNHSERYAKKRLYGLACEEHWAPISGAIHD